MRPLLLVSLLVGCGGSPPAAPHDMAVPIDFPPPTPALCQDNQIGDAGLPAIWTNVEKVLDGQCSMGQCHYSMFSVPRGFGVDLRHGFAYGNLINKIAPDSPNQCGGFLVTPGDPAHSYLLVKLTTPRGQQCNPVGQQMPVGEPFSTPLDPCLVDLFRRWILAGAPS